jgi:hypothetical protein
LFKAKFIVGCVLLIGGSAAHAATIFNLTGTFQSGSTFTAGSEITIDTALGTITGLNIGISAPDTVAYTLASGVLLPLVSPGLEIEIGAVTPFLNLLLPVSTLTGYTGGPLCTSGAGGCPGASALSPIGARDFLVSGSLTPAPTATPEVSSLSMAVLGGLVLASVRRRALTTIKS